MRDDKLTRRSLLKQTASAATAAMLAGCLSPQRTRTTMKTFNIKDYGARGDGTSLDSAPIQRAIDAAAATASATNPARVLIPARHTYLIGTLQLRSHIDFHLEGDSRLLVSTNPDDYAPQAGVVAEGFDPKNAAALIASGADNLRITGTGTIDGRSREFMDHYDEPNEWWIFKPFRPRLVVLTACRDLQILNFSLVDAPLWTLHLLGCHGVLIDGIHIKNQLDVPNCDGIDPDHCSDVEIKNCDITCGDDAIVIKTTRQTKDYGPCKNIRVKDCLLHTQDAGLKIGTETTADISDLTFERITITSSCRGIGIQLRDNGNVSNITFRDITFTSRYHSDPWWGRGEAISLTAIPRTPNSPIGTLSNIRFQNITGRSENSLRIEGSAQSRIRDISLDNVSLTLDRWTKYKGALFDNRPTTSQTAIEPHNTPAIFLRHADNITLNKCSIAWGKNIPDYFSHALEAQDVTNLANTNFTGNAAHPDRDKPIAIS